MDSIQPASHRITDNSNIVKMNNIDTIIFYIEQTTHRRKGLISFIIFSIFLLVFMMYPLYLSIWYYFRISYSFDSVFYIFITLAGVLTAIWILTQALVYLIKYQRFQITNDGIYPHEKSVFPLHQHEFIMRSDILRIEIIVMKNKIAGLDIITTNNKHYCIYPSTGVGSLSQIVAVLDQQKYNLMWRGYIARNTYEDISTEISKTILKP